VLNLRFLAIRITYTIEQIKAIDKAKSAVLNKLYYTNTDEVYIGTSENKLRKMITE